MKEPLIWFVLIGALLFAADQFRAPDSIIVNPDEQDILLDGCGIVSLTR